MSNFRVPFFYSFFRGPPRKLPVRRAVAVAGSRVRYTQRSGDYIVCSMYIQPLAVAERSKARVCSRQLAGFRVRSPAAERSKVRVCGRWLAGIASSNSAGGMDVWVVCIFYSKGQNAKPEQSGKEVHIKYKEQKKKTAGAQWIKIPENLAKIQNCQVHGNSVKIQALDFSELPVLL